MKDVLATDTKQEGDCEKQVLADCRQFNCRLEVLNSEELEAKPQRFNSKLNSDLKGKAEQGELQLGIEDNASRGAPTVTPSRSQ